MSRRGDRAAVLRAAKRAGCTVERQRRHVILRTPNGTRIVTSGTPSDGNAVLNLRRDLERAGVVLEP